MKKNKFLAAVLFGLFPALLAAQTSAEAENWLTSPGVIGTIALVVIVLVIAVLILLARLNAYISKIGRKRDQKDRLDFSEELIGLEEEEIDEILEKRKAAKKYKLNGNELGSENRAEDRKGLIHNLTSRPENPLFDEKKKSNIRLETPENLKKIVVYYLSAATFWLVFGTFIGEYLGLKFVWPELDNFSWLSFGRLRPVHTNTVFWGWSSLAMIGLGYFVVARTSNTVLHSYKLARWGFILINLAVIVGNLTLMAGINNGGAEYREYVWPVMIIFMAGMIITLINFYKTVAKRKISEIYISNWFMLAALLFIGVIAVVGYLPFYQDGLGETVIAGFYMHNAVGMWFMTFTLGLVYYYLPASLNKPIYSYSLGVLAFWTQILFYTNIGTHHFVFSPIPWWLQTVAIVFSAGMFIPVIAGATNFLLTMKGSFNQISKSYVLPFFLVGAIFYFVGSSQGSFQAFRFTQYIWHFTDFNVAHSHMTMYGIIAFFLWAGIYTIVPKLTGKEPPQILVGAHFWMAFVGLFAYMISLMAGGSLKGLSWIEGNAFIESVVLMKEYWVWRAVGGSLMFFSHIVFAYNFYYMVKNRTKNQIPNLKPKPVKTKSLTEKKQIEDVQFS